MTTAATITANLILNAKDFQSGIKKAEAGTRSFSDKLKSMQTALERSATWLSGKLWQLRMSLENAGRAGNPLALSMIRVYGASKTVGKAIDNLRVKLANLDQRIRLSKISMDDMGNKFLSAGRKMSLFITLPILGFFTLLIKKAMDADTALGKLAKESVGRLNDSLAKLGEKFLPLFIKFVDWVTKLVDEFLALPPGTQAFITKLALLAAMAGPMTTFAGSLMKVFAFFGSSGMGGMAVKWIVGTLLPALKLIGTTIWTSLIPAVTSAGTAIWTALLPLLPILALIAATIVLIYLLWKNWDQLGVILSQLWFIIEYGFKKMWDGMKSAMAEGLDAFESQTQKSISVWKNNWKQAQEIQAKLFKLAMTTMHSAVMDFVAKASLKFTEFRNNVMSAVGYIGNIFYSVFSSIGSFVNSIIVGIINGINVLIGAINQLGFALNTLEIPPELTPGSPTPFEIGLLGISKAMASIAKKSIPKMNVGLAPDSISSGMGGGRKDIRITDNRRFAAGLDAKTLRMALDERFDGLTEALENI